MERANNAGEARLAREEPKVRIFEPHGRERVDALAGIPLASFSRRALAFVLDFFLVLALFVPGTVLVRWLMAEHRHLEHVDVEFNFHNPASLVALVVYFGLALYWGNGQTLGKRLTGIRVLSLAHDRITFWQSFERALGYGASMLEAGFGFLQYFIHPNRCCVHDRIAETIVVRDSDSKSRD